MTPPSERAKEIVDNLLVWLGGGDKDRSPEQIAAQIDAFAAEAVRAEREACAEIAENPYGDQVRAYGGRRLGDEPLAVGKKIAAAIRARTPASEENV